MTSEQQNDVAVLLLDGAAHDLRHNGDGDILCPKCGHNDVSMWADDGEAWAADWWQCEKHSGGCGSTGAVVPTHDHAHTQNGCAVITISVHPQTMPTTTAAFHSSATHVDAIGMPVAFYHDEFLNTDTSYHPTPCCGAAASISDPEYGMYCKACYEQVDGAFGNVPVEPIRLISEVQSG